MARMPRQWLFDRFNGTSQYDPDHRPPLQCCCVPLCVKICPDILEQNCCCEACGRCGCIRERHTRIRLFVLWTALISNIVGLTLMFLSALAMADNSFGILWHFPYTSVWLNMTQGPEDFNEPAMYRVGLQAIAFQGFKRDQQGIVPFAEICDVGLTGPTAHFVLASAVVGGNGERGSVVSDCNDCEMVSRRIVPSLFLSMLSYIPNFTTDVLRMWVNYDVNCQKTLATTFSWVSFATAIHTWVNYRERCWASFNTDPIALDEDLQPVDLDTPDVHIVVEFNWEAGLAQVCLAAATLLKLIDIVCNFVLQTPTITRDFVEQAAYERRYGIAFQEEGDVEEPFETPKTIPEQIASANEEKDKKSLSERVPSSTKSLKDE